MDDNGQIIIYQSEDGQTHLEVKMENETLWLPQKAIAQLFNVGVPAISKHLKNIFETGELRPETTISKMETVVNRGFRGDVKELEAIKKQTININQLNNTGVC